MAPPSPEGFFRAIAHEVFAGGGAAVSRARLNVTLCPPSDGAANVVARVRAPAKRGTGLVIKRRVDPHDDAGREVWALRRLRGQAGPRLVASFNEATLQALLGRVAARGDFDALVDLDVVGGGVIVMDDVGGAVVDGDPADVADDVVAAVAGAIADLMGARITLRGLLPLASGSSVAALVGGAGDLVDDVTGLGLGDDASRRQLRLALLAAERHALARHPGTRVRRLCHGDLRFFNVVINDGDDGVARLIDFEFAGVGDPAVDVAMMAVRTPLSDHQELVLLDTLARRLGRGAADFLARYFAVKPLAAMVGALGGLVDLALVARGARAIVADAGHAHQARQAYLRRRGPALRLELQEALERCQRFTRGTAPSSSSSSSPKKTAQALMPSSPATARLPSPSGEGLGMGHRQRTAAGPGRCGRVAIDGTAASGKSVIARAVAERYGVPHYNTGAAYRAFALLAQRAGVAPPPLATKAPHSTATMARALAKAQAAFARADVALSEDGAVLVDGRRLEYSLLISEVEETVALWARHPAVRGAVDVVIAEALRKKSAVVEGRDVGSRLWPRAPTRLFLTASLDARAERVVERQGQKRGLREVRASLARRDHIDATRDVDAMACAPGAIAIDTTTRRERDVIRAVLSLIAVATRAAP